MIMHLIAEGDSEETVAKRLLPFCGHELGVAYGKDGCAYIRDKAVKFRHLATENSGVLVLTDFRDAKARCVPEALQDYIFEKLPSHSNLPKKFLCRFAVNELESWLLADQEGLAGFFSISVSKIPLQPENEAFPKKTLVNLARASRKREIREGIAPPQGHKAAVGPNYQPLMNEFISNIWNIEAAMRCAPSLERCVHRLQDLSQKDGKI